MNIAIVAPSPIPFAPGGAESLFGGLRDAITELTAHQVDVIKLPAGEGDLWDFVDGYRRFATLDLRHFDLVISTKYPAWIVQHPRHVCYLMHRCRRLYELYPEALGTALPDHLPEVRALGAFMEEHQQGPPTVLEELFSRLDELRGAAARLPPEVFARVAPLTRHVVRFLDDFALSPQRIRRFLAISHVVAARPGYFPAGVHVDVLPPPSRLRGFKDVGAEHLFTSSRLEKLKRVDLLVKAMRLARTSLPLLVAGTGPHETTLRELAGTDDRIRLLGFVPDDELVELYGRALAVPFVPYDEDFGLVTVEAMMSGKPVLTCTDSGGTLDLVTDGETGVVAEPNPEAIARGIERLTGDVESTRRMGRSARDRVRPITWERTVETLLEERVPGRARPATVRPRPAVRPRVTVAVPFEVYPPSGGGQHRIFSLYRRIAAVFDVELVTLGPSGSSPLEAEIAPGVREIRIPKTTGYFERELELAGAAGHLPIGDVAAALLLDRVPEYRDFLARSLEGAAVAVLSHPFAIRAIPPNADVPLVYEAHNVEASLKEATFGPGIFTRAASEAEAEACRLARLVFACSLEDGDDLVRRYGIDRSRVRVAPNGVDTDVIPFTGPADRLRRKAELGLAGTSIALFVGSWHPPNVDAGETILDLARALPRVTFLLAGNHTVRLTTRPQLPNVALMGAVDDATLASLLAVADVALNPMRRGSGTNLKVATYLAAGLPVVTTPFGARGYGLRDMEHALVAPVEAFPDRIGRLLGDGALVEGVSAAGRRLAEERYDWAVIAAGMIADLRALLEHGVTAAAV